MDKECSMHGREFNPCRVWVGKLEGKNHQEDIGIGEMMDLKEIELKDVDCIHVTEDTDQ